MMTFLEDAKYCAAVVHAAEKYNTYGINVVEELDYVENLEEELKYNVTKSENDVVLLTNRVFFLRHLVIKMCKDELGTDANIELFRMVKQIYTIMGELIIRCNNGDPKRFDFMDDLSFNKSQVEFALKNCNGNRKLIFMLILNEIEYVIKRYCKSEFIEAKDRADNN